MQQGSEWSVHIPRKSVPTISGNEPRIVSQIVCPLAFSIHARIGGCCRLSAPGLAAPVRRSATGEVPLTREGRCHAFETQAGMTYTIGG